MSATSQVTDTDLAWAAGIVDGEGCIHMVAIPPHHWSVKVSVGNTDARITIALQRLFDGGIHTYQKRAPRRPIHVWSKQGDEAMEFLRIIRPFLVGKQDQADVAIEAREYQRANRYTRAGTGSREEKLARLSFAYTKLRTLKAVA